MHCCHCLKVLVLVSSGCSFNLWSSQPWLSFKFQSFFDSYRRRQIIRLRVQLKESTFIRCLYTFWLVLFLLRLFWLKLHGQAYLWKDDMNCCTSIRDQNEREMTNDRKTRINTAIRRIWTHDILVESWDACTLSRCSKLQPQPCTCILT